MKIRLIFWALAGLGVVVAGALLMPSSPYYYPNLMASQPQYYGQTARFWMKALDSDDQKTRHEAIKALGAIGNDAGDAVPRLAKIMLEDDDRIARNQAAFALSRMTPASEAAVEPLTTALTDEELPIRMNAAIALFRLREKARAATTTLLTSIDVEANQTNLSAFPLTIQEQMILTLGVATAGSDEAIPKLTEQLKKAKDDSMRKVIVRAFGFIGAPAKVTIPLIQPLKEKAGRDLSSEIDETLRKLNEIKE